MRKYINAIIICLITVTINGQTEVELFLQSVEKNNPVLIASREMTNAMIWKAKTSIMPDNPEVEYAYMPGNNSSLGTKTLFGISQSFEFPTVYSVKNKISNQQSVSHKDEYQIIKQGILLKAENLFYEYVFLRKKKEEYNSRLENASRIHESYTKKLEAGNASILEANKAKILHLSMKSQMQILEQNLNSVQQELTYLNGNEAFSINAVEYPNRTLDALDSLKNIALASSPKIKFYENELIIGSLKQNLSKQEWLPEFTIGYESEKESEGTFAGVKAGITIPLWKDKNTVKYSNALYNYQNTILNSKKIELFSDIEKKYSKALKYKLLLDEFSATLNNNEDIGYIEKAFNAGQISIIEYIMELMFYYDVTDQYLETEKVYHQTLAEVYSYRL